MTLSQEETHKTAVLEKPVWKDIVLWGHQVTAVETIQSYLASFSTHTTSALIRMPTGSGKTVVMAVVSQLLQQVDSVLIVAPWAQLTEQLDKEISDRVWNKLKVDAWEARKRCRRFQAAEISDVLKKAGDDPTIFLCTNQSLERLYAASLDASSPRQKDYATLKAKISLVLVDEGHREPAPKWANAVRSLSKPTVLFTATPYRNDLRLFKIDAGHVFRYLHQEAVNGNFIRQVEVREVAFGETPETFVKALLAFFDGEFQNIKPSMVTEPRVIVRCATSDEIKEVASYLKADGRTVVEVHENFSDDEDDSRVSKVPDPSENDAVFWVHQNKLIEGVDDPKFCLLAVYQPLSNSRALVQQVGRILRNPELKPDQKAFVFSHPRHKLKAKWDAYLAYEALLGGDIREAGPKEMFAQVTEIQNHLVYLDGNYRERFTPDDPNFHEHLAFRLATSVFKPEQTYSFDAFLTDLLGKLDEDDSVLIGSTRPDQHTFILMYARCHTSPLLFDQTFLEFGLGYTVIRESGGWVFCYDTSGMTPLYLQENARHVPPALLERLLPQGRTRVSQVSLLNSDLGNFSVRRRSISARAVEDMAPGLADYSHFCSTISGSVESGQNQIRRRYVGFTRGRVSQMTSDPIRYRDYVDWLESIAAELNSNQTIGAELLNRYAAFQDAPAKPNPIHILLDIEDIQNEYVALDSLGQGEFKPMQFDDACCDISKGRFECEVNGKKIPVDITYRSDRKRFELKSSGLDQHYVHQRARAERRQSILSFLNSRQAFRVIMDDGSIYAHGQFYKSRVPLWGRASDNRIDLANILIPSTGLTVLTSEKGHKNQTGWTHTDRWQPGSVFDYIDGNGQTSSLFTSQAFQPDILICDDLGNELADFIAVQQSPPRIALIHAKYTSSSDKRVSASGFHDVCGQAVKNLGVLNPQWDGSKNNTKGWLDKWTVSGIGEVDRRIRFNQTGIPDNRLWQEIQKVVRHPAATREVWIVMGGGLSRSVFETERKKTKPLGEVIQFIYLLQSTWSSVSTVGGLLKVCCRP
jgi:superfamily II DNA or RNA helicase